MKIFSLHSQKGGTGKTSIAISVVLEAIKRGHKPLLIDADLSGTSIRDILHFDTLPEPHQAIEEFFLDLKPRNPLDYIASAAINDGLTQQKRNIPILVGKNRNPLQLMPLVYKENHTHYLRTRLENLINAAQKHQQIDVIVIDNSPGSWGLSHATRELIKARKLSSNSKVVFEGKSILVSSTDLNDVLSCVDLQMSSKDGDSPYTYIINRSQYGEDIPTNEQKIAESLDLKGTALNFPDYFLRAQEVREKKLIRWVAKDDAGLSGVYKSHVQNFQPVENISKLGDVLWNDGV